MDTEESQDIGGNPDHITSWLGLALRLGWSTASPPYSAWEDMSCLPGMCLMVPILPHQQPRRRYSK